MKYCDGRGQRKEKYQEQCKKQVSSQPAVHCVNRSKLDL